MSAIQEMLPVLIPLIILEVGLGLGTMIHVIRHPNYKFGNKALWIVLSFVNIIGPILYFTVGKGED
ncbi:PLDc N-terminal domain-containing protein [Anaerosporobacter sp.]|uniref:PLDc N-terminal domain-containing protein n=1 Tax=Anaerosporobacter sp. TaxID=1872529 RepID=UPI00286F0391|nr:PLDc N-terminal domain-containing protein [Anaerosporobacter sp.]